MLIIPAIDLKDKKCVRLFKGDYNKVEVFSDNPVEVAKKWESQGAKLIHIVDLDGAKKGFSVNGEIIENIVKSVNIDVEVGGGIRDEETVARFFSIGVKRLVIGSMMFKNQSLAKTLFSLYNGSIIPSLDVKDKYISISGWLEDTRFTIDDAIPYLEGFGVSEFIITDIKRDGTLRGFDTALLEYISEKYSNLKFIVGGGITSMEDLERISKFPFVTGVIIGKALYTGKIDFSQAISLYKGDV
ncbi:MAG TPA: 1-(5-phosphoribosyl)-5-[(5-phosphoribosylamino)methylideneamino]imidazole-4-carboxamide isomerase [Candidatus Atribacteria bacterium]|nr:1-(5-phosphoribosyl)-5-[(5-phosphoribosylamino)methylideneamino]imidazole-4-carboxamide isomerase [Candidatus Atribacteria bacterium]